MSAPLSPTARSWRAHAARRALLVAASALIALASTSAPPHAAAQGARGEPRSAASAQNAQKSGAEGLAIGVRLSYATNLFHWLDNLAGSSIGKTSEAYLRAWAERHGLPSARERALLRRFRALRLDERGLERADAFAVEGACAPATAPRSSRREELSVLAMESDTVDELLHGAKPLLESNEHAQLAAALRHFDPLFRPIWNDQLDDLSEFRDELVAFLDEREPRALLARLGRLFGEGLELERPTTIALVGVPARDLGTHAEAMGRHLLLEVRPRERVREQVQVVFHELTHDLWERAEPAARARWASAFLRLGREGALAWNLQLEAIPTAIGQGYAEAELVPRAFSLRKPWYHLEVIDRYAKALYPRLYDTLEEGAPLDDALIAGLVEDLPGPLLREAPLVAHLGAAAYAAPSGALPALARLAQRAPAHGSWILDASDPSTRRFLEDFSCTPLVVLRVGTPASPASSDAASDAIGASAAAADAQGGAPGADARPADPALLGVPPAERAPPEGWPELADDALGVALPGRRPSGAAALWLLARDEEALEALVERLAALERWPARRVVIER